MAGRGRLLQTNFSAGELSPAMRARVDIEPYGRALELCENFVPRKNGALDRRSGCAYLGAPPAADAPVRWLVFQRSVNDVVRVELQGGVMRFWDNATRTLIERGGAPVELSHPWGDGDLFELRTFQEGDVMWICHAGHGYAPHVLVRRALDTFELTEYALEEGPFTDRTGDEARLSFSGVTGNVSISADGDAFAPGHVGALIRLEAESFSSVSNWAFDQVQHVGDYVKNGNRIYRCTHKADPGKTGDSPPIHESGEEWDGSDDDNLLWRFEGFTYGLVEITSVTGARQASGRVLRRLPFYGADQTATDFWEISALSDESGWPACGVIFEDRVGFFGSRARPDYCFLSRTQRWRPESADFRPGFPTEIVDDDAVRRSIGKGASSHIVWAADMDGLLLGTTTGVRRLAGPSADEGITPAGAVPRDVSMVACSPRMPALLGDNSLLYVALSEREVIEVSRDPQAFPRDIKELADHIAPGGFKAWAMCDRPRRHVWSVDVDGALSSLTYSPENNTIAWARHRLGGELDGGPPAIDDVCAAMGPAGEMELWLTVKRTQGGRVVRSHEYMPNQWDVQRQRLSEACHLDMAFYLDLWRQEETARLRLSEGPGETFRLVIEGDAPFREEDVARQIWLSQNGPRPREGDKPEPVRLAVLAYVSDTELEVDLEGQYDRAAWENVAFARWGKAVQAIVGLNHLAGEQVMGNLDGVTVRGLGVDATGRVELPIWTVRAWVGYGYASHARTLPANGAEGLGSARTTTGRVVQMGMMFDAVAEGVVRRADAAEGHEVLLRPRAASDPLGMAPAASREDLLVELDSSYDTEKQIELIADGALPCSVAGLVMLVESYG